MDSCSESHEAKVGLLAKTVMLSEAWVSVCAHPGWREILNVVGPQASKPTPYHDFQVFRAPHFPVERDLSTA